MSATTKIKRQSVTDIRARKGGTPVVCLTAYTTPMARLLDEHVDLMLVGDSLGMVLYGMESTLGVSLEMMIHHGKAVRRGSDQACIVVDMPFGSYQESPRQAFRNAGRVMAETGCSAVKLEGGAEMAETIEFLTQRGVPVMAHIGLQPQSVNTHGGYNARGRSAAEQQKILDDAIAVAQAGAFSCVVEGTIEPLARRITEAIDIPTIGIGGSPACDGQILVTEDMLGLFGEFTPKFVKRFANLGEQVDSAVAQYAEEVRLRQFPGDAHIFKEKKAAKIVKSA